MTTTVPKPEFLGRLLRLSRSILEALNRGDVEVASSLFEERARYFESHQPGDEPDHEGQLDALLECDRLVVAKATAMRAGLATSGRTLNRAKGYGDGSLPPRPGGDWGSG